MIVRKAFAVRVMALTMAASSFPALADAGASAPKFSELEYQAPRDPLLASNAAIGDLHHTPQADLRPAVDALRQAIPAGTPRAVAEAALRRAGASCKAIDASAEKCGYFDVATRDEYVDDVHWNVKLHLASGRVTGLAVDQVWTRH